jgi:exodeoxyribonuclease-1
MAQRWGVDVEQALRHADVAARRGPSMAGIWPDVFARPAAERAVDVDEDLYGGFVGTDDRRQLQRLRALAPEQLAAKAVAFQDPRLAELLFRWRARNFAHTLSDDERERWQQHRTDRLIDGAGGATTLQAFFDRIDALGETLADDDERGQAILGALYDYAEQIAP